MISQSVALSAGHGDSRFAVTLFLFHLIEFPLDFCFPSLNMSIWRHLRCKCLRLLTIGIVGCIAHSLNNSASGQVAPIAAGSWTLAVLPDTQIYAESYPQHFNAQTQWIVDHAESHNIQYVLHEGDITNRNTRAQWDNAFASMNRLNGVVPYAMAPGNHDYGPGGNGATRDSLFNTPEYFGPGSFYANQASIGGFYESGKTDNSWHTFAAGNSDWLVLALEWGPRDEVVEWANQVVADHPNHNTMLVTHAYMYYDETIYDWENKGSSQSWNPHSYGIEKIGSVNDGQELWDGLVSQHGNFRMTFNGHVLNDGTGFRSTLGVNQNPVQQMLANYQMNAEGGRGDMRLLEFKADGSVVVRTYSPVLDRHDTSYDQQFTFRLDELRDPLSPPPPPLIPTAVASNTLVTGPTDPSVNTVESVSIPKTGTPAISTLQVNRGDYQIAIDEQGPRYQDGVLLATIRENERDGYQATVEVGRNSFGDDILSLSVMETGNPGNKELNVNTAVAWFQFAAGWQGAHVNANGTLAPGASNRVQQSMITRQAAGRYKLDLDVDSRNDGLLFVVANNNGNTIVQTAPLDSGEGWDIRVQDNASDFAAVGDDRDFSFVYLPIETENLTAGRYNGVVEANELSVGDFTINRTANGQYELTIPGQSPETGMLLLSIARSAQAAGVVAPDDNTLSYSATTNGSFLIESRDLPSGNLQNTSFAWAFIRFDDPIAPPTPAGDDDRDGDVDGADDTRWRSQFGRQGVLTADGNNVVDAADRH